MEKKVEHITSAVKDLKVESVTAESAIVNPKQYFTLKSSSSVENLDHELRDVLYEERRSYLKAELVKIKLDELNITEDDLKDKSCDPNNPVKVTFNDISAAAYRIKAGIEMTPCKP